MESDDRWAWKLRLFLSADIVGSTAFKASKATSLRSSEWASTFREFFTEFPKQVSVNYDSLPDNKFPVCNPASPWKFSGDEILFETQLSCHTEVITHLYAFKRAACEYPAEWEKNEIPLKLKCTAWIAGFPVNNTEIRLSHGGQTLTDYIGPGIDLGFRLASFATERRFVLSADLGLMLLDAIHHAEVDAAEFNLYFRGRESLKGVIDGKPYPIIWLKNDNIDPDIEEQLLGKPETDKLTNYLRRFLDDTSGLERPFIANDPHEKYREIPDRFEKARKEMMAEESLRDYSNEAGDVPAAQAPPAELEAPELPQKQDDADPSA